jgi:hypothetical protein
MMVGRNGKSLPDRLQSIFQGYFTLTRKSGARMKDFARISSRIQAQTPSVTNSLHLSLRYSTMVKINHKQAALDFLSFVNASPTR